MVAPAGSIREWRGLGISPGIGIGRAYVVDRGPMAVTRVTVGPAHLEREVRRVRRAFAEALRHIARVRRRVAKTLGTDHLVIIDAHRMILEDPWLLSGVEERIRREGVAAEWALHATFEHFTSAFDQSDEYLRQRKDDILHVRDQVLTHLAGRRCESLAEIPEGAIVIAHDLAPTDTAQMIHGRVVGFVTEVGGHTSHTAIMARSLGIPAVVGLRGIGQHVRAGDLLVVDGGTGTVVAHPGSAALRRYRERRETLRLAAEALGGLATLPAITPDGRQVRLMANIELLDEVPALAASGAEGIGLYRTEFLYLDRDDLPSEEEHVAVYEQVLKAAAPHPATIRTFDLGGDKFVSKMALAPEMNPALGLRAIRFYFREPHVFTVQVRALLRASVHGPLAILLPMVSGVEEVHRARALIDACRADLRADAPGVDPPVQIGIMIEVPSAAAVADHLAREVDFFSVGTNDLIQYFLAIDRVNDEVAYLYEPLHPAVLRTLKGVVDAGHSAGIPVAICGEMAGEPLYTPVLLGLGFDALSMRPPAIARVKQVVRATHAGDAARLVADLVALPTARHIADHLAAWCDAQGLALAEEADDVGRRVVGS